MAVEDVEKTAFLTPCGVYCYTCMPFGLRNAGATFQRLRHIALGRQLGRNTGAYVDDIMVKSREAKTLIQDLEETFARLAKWTCSSTRRSVCLVSLQASCWVSLCHTEGSRPTRKRSR